MVKILLKSIFYRFLSSTWGHVGAMLRPFRSIFALKGCILFRRRFEVDFCAVSEPSGPSKMTVSFRREYNFQFFVKLLWDVDFCPISGPERCGNRPQEGTESQLCTRQERRSKMTSRPSARDAQAEVVQRGAPPLVPQA